MTVLPEMVPFFASRSFKELGIAWQWKVSELCGTDEAWGIENKSHVAIEKEEGKYDSVLWQSK